MNQVVEIRRMEAELFRRHRGDELGAGLERGIEKFQARCVRQEMGLIGGREKSALMMIEPPSETRAGRVLEIHDGVDVAVELRFIEQLGSLVREAGIVELGGGIDLSAEEAAEDRRGTGAVETTIVEKDADFHGENT